MKDKYHQHYVHITWTVSERRRLLDAPHDAAMTAELRAACVAQRCMPLAIVCLPDQAHLLINISPAVSLDAFARAVKRRTHLAIAKRLPRGSAFAWASGFVACSVSPRDADETERFLRELRAQHAHRRAMAALEAGGGERMANDPACYSHTHKPSRYAALPSRSQPSSWA